MNLIIFDNQDDEYTKRLDENYDNGYVFIHGRYHLRREAFNRARRILAPR